MPEENNKPQNMEELMKEFGTYMQDHMKREQETRVRNFRVLNRLAVKGAILMTGSSLMEHFQVTEMAVSAGISTPVYNRGIGGTTTDDFLREIDTVLFGTEPSKVFINIGTNDMTDRVYGDRWMDHLEANYDEILRKTKERLPQTKVYVMAYYPANLHMPGMNEVQREMIKCRSVENIAECSRRVHALADRYGYEFINVNDGLTNENGELKEEFCIDGIHMYAEAYEVIFRNLLPYLKD